MHIAERPVQHVINACTCLTSVSCASVCVCVRSESNSIAGFSQPCCQWLRAAWCMWLIYFHTLSKTPAIISFVYSLSIHSGSIQAVLIYCISILKYELTFITSVSLNMSLECFVYALQLISKWRHLSFVMYLKSIFHGRELKCMLFYIFNSL